MLLCFCSLHLICPFYLHPVQQQSGMNVPVSLLQDTFFALSSSVTVSCLFERPFTPNSPAPFSLTACSQLTFLPTAWFCLLSCYVLILLIIFECLQFFFRGCGKLGNFVK